MMNLIESPIKGLRYSVIYIMIKLLNNTHKIIIGAMITPNWTSLKFNLNFSRFQNTLKKNKYNKHKQIKNK